MTYDKWPTFDRCPKCRGMVWTDGRGRWCIECDYSIEQATLDL